MLVDRRPVSSQQLPFWGGSCAAAGIMSVDPSQLA
jgi:hypothetical protein